MGDTLLDEYLLNGIWYRVWFKDLIGTVTYTLDSNGQWVFNDWGI